MLRLAVIVALLILREDMLAGEAPQAEKTQANYQSLCENCHGERGDGKGVSAPTLRTKPKDFAKMPDKSEAHIFKVIKEGGPAVKQSPLMPSYADQLGDDQIRQMVRYVLSLGQGRK